MSDLSQAPAKRKYTRRAESIRPEPVREAAVRPMSIRPKATERLQPGHQDQLGIPADVLALYPDCDFQWVTDSVLGKPELQTRMGYERNGWEPCPPDLPGISGRWHPNGHQGEINNGGLVLMWRRMELTQQAKAEDYRAAKGALAAHESNIKRGAVDGITMDTQHPTARAVTGVKREMVSPLTQNIATGIPVPK